MSATVTGSSAVERGRRVLRLEREAIAEAERRLDESFARAVALIAGTPGRVIVAGVGKSGLIGRKIAATLTSTGTPATFLHPVESVHGDLGMVGPDDVAILLSKSGETEEVLALLQHLQRLGVRTLAITSEIGLAARPACRRRPWMRGCARRPARTTWRPPRAPPWRSRSATRWPWRCSRSAASVVRTSLACTRAARSVRRLLTRVADVMLRDDLPVLPLHATMREAVVQLAERRGIAIVCDDDGRVLGVVTSGDFTRLLEREEQCFPVPVEQVMNRSPKLAAPDELGSAVVYRMERHGIMSMPVVTDAGRLVGVVHLHDLMRAGAA